MTKSACGKCYWKEDCEDIERCQTYNYDCWKFRSESNKFDTVSSEPDKNGSNLYMHGGSNH